MRELGSGHASPLPWGNPPYPQRPAPRTTFGDVWDAVFGRRLTFYRVELDGSSCLVDRIEVDEYHRQNATEGHGYVITPVRMTQRQVEAMPEFQGF